MMFNVIPKGLYNDANALHKLGELSCRFPSCFSLVAVQGIMFAQTGVGVRKNAKRKQGGKSPCPKKKKSKRKPNTGHLTLEIYLFLALLGKALPI